MKAIKKLSDSKIFWLVVSFLVSLSVWVYVTSVETVEATRTFRNIPIELVGEDTLLNMRELVITDLDTTTVTVEISGPRRIVNALDDDDLIAQVDVSRLSQTAYTTLNYTIIYPSGVDRRNLQIINKSRDSVSFMVSKMTSKTIPVQGGFEGKAATGYIQETPSFEPATITVSGPEVYLRNVHHAYVTFGRDQVLESTYSVETSYTLMDANGDPCSTDNLTISPDTIRATLPVLAVKDVPLKVSLQYGAGATESNTNCTIEPKTLRLAGDAAVLAEINQIELDAIDLTTFASEYSETYTIPVPNGLRNLTGATEATVKIEISDLTTKTVVINDFTWEGLSGDLDVVVNSVNVPILLRGPADQLRNVNAYSIRATANLSDYINGLGSYSVPLEIEIPNYDDVGTIQVDGLPDYKIIIEIVPKTAEPEETEGEQT